jgi:hypothetical protein
MAKMPFTPSAEEAKSAFQNSMFYEIAVTFGVPTHDPTDYSQWELINFTRMAHARLLYDFLEKGNDERHKKDVLAVDYGYPSQTIALSDDDRDRLNQDLLHFSYERLRHTPETKRWPSSILGNLLDPVLGFMRYVREQRKDLFDTCVAWDRWRYLIQLFESGRELRIKVVAELNHGLRYDFGLGLALPGGKPILTPIIPCSLMMPDTGSGQDSSV